MVTLTAHQPNLLPYAGFFQKMREADIFVLLTNCQFEKNNYQNRFFTDKWNTMRVSKKTENICDKQYLFPEKDWAKIVKDYPVLEQFTPFLNKQLWIMNGTIIMEAARLMGIKTNICVDFPTDKKGTERILELCRHYGADVYLSGPSGRNYLDEGRFSDVRLKYFTPSDERPLCEIL